MKFFFISRPLKNKTCIGENENTYGVYFIQKKKNETGKLRGLWQIVCQLL